MGRVLGRTTGVAEDALVPCEKHEILNCRTCKDQAEAKMLASVDALTPGERMAFTQSNKAKHTFVARYDGQCPECDLPIMAGKQRIYLNEHRQAVHEYC